MPHSSAFFNDVSSHELDLLLIAGDFAQTVRADASDTDRRAVLPQAQLEALARSGLLAAGVPRAHGGGGASVRTQIEIIRRLASGDPSLAQTMQSHYSNVDRIVHFGSAKLQNFLFPCIVAGERIGNATAEKGGAHAGLNATTLAHGDNGNWRLNGKKAYATGALTAHWISVRAVGPCGAVLTAYVAREARGVGTKDNWRALGQRATASGEVVFEAVEVNAAMVCDFSGGAPEVELNRAFTLLLHGAIQAGIARDALQDGIRFVRRQARQHAEVVAEGGARQVGDDPLVQHEVGRLATRVRAAELLIAHAGYVIDQARRPGAVITAAIAGDAWIAMGEAKAYAAEVAVETANDIFAMAGSSAADEELNLSRHWRNARTYSLHDSGRWKYLQNGRFLLTGAYPGAEKIEAPTLKGSPSVYTTLIQAPDLRDLLCATEAPLLFDCSFDLTAPAAGADAYLQAHIPGARHLNLEHDLSGVQTGENGRHPLPDAAVFALTLRRHGLRRGQQVVLYDGQGAMYAARAWWMLRWLGHEAVAVLDGGLQAWKDAGHALASGISAPADIGDFEAGDSACTAAATVDAAQVLANIAAPVFQVLDARTAQRFWGEASPFDTVAGHIPGARNRFFKDNLNAAGRFKPAPELAADFRRALGLDADAASAAGVVLQCGSGVTACHNALALAVAGLDGARLYPGSWSEWTADPARPVA